MKTTAAADHNTQHDLYLLLSDLFYLLDDHDRQFFGEYGLSARQFWTLHHLSETDGLSMIDLSRLLFTDKSNVTAIADRLETAGLITRSPAPQDRRVIVLTLTPDGAERHAQALAAHHQRIRSLIGDDEAALEQALGILESIRSRFEQHFHPGASHTPATPSTPAGGKARGHSLP
ncbi:MAG: MarR family transcriptional regulator [Chloroflexota bacterium]|nr:MarR family transcriptional regulator [Chloroflexota bacterium]